MKKIGHEHKVFIFLILIITAIAFYPSLLNDFTNWDDPYYVTENKSIHEFSLKSIKTIFTSNYVGNYQPITLLTYLIEYSLFRDHPQVYHFTNLLLHLGNSLLVYFLIFMLFKNTSSACFTALLFGIHPMHVESVAWIAERKDVLCTFFLLASLNLYLINQNNKKTYLYLTSLFLFLFSLLSKPMGITLPAIIHLIDYLNSGKDAVRKARPVIPFWALSIFFIILTLITQNKSGATELSEHLSVWNRICLASHGILFYIVKLFYPANLSAYYDYPPRPNGNFPLIFSISPFVLLILSSAIFMTWKKTRKAIFGYSFFIITILPVSQIIPVGGTIAADRYTYIPYIGLFAMIGEAINSIYRNNLQRRKLLRILPSLIFVLVVFIFSWLTYQRCKVWQDGVTLWNDVLSKNPNTIMAINNRGQSYIKQGKFKEALEDFNHGLKVEPGSWRTFYNRGSVYFELGRYEESLADLNRGIEKKKDFPELYFNRGTTLMRLKKFDEAIEDFNKAIELKPDYPTAFNRRGICYNCKDMIQEALNDMNQAINLNPDFALAYIERANLYIKLNQPQKAREDFLKVIRELKYSVDKKVIQNFDNKFPEYRILKAGLDKDTKELQHSSAKQQTQ